MKTLRSLLFWLHLTAGVVAGLVILIMSVTGALLAFKPQIQRFVDRDVRVVQPPESGARRLGVQSLVANARLSKPDAQIASIALDADPNASAALSLGREGTIYVDPYTGRVLGEGSRSLQASFRWLEDWHRWLGSSTDRATGRALTAACNLAFLVLAISGLYLWWPRKWLPQHVKAILTFRRDATGRARDFNWHNVIGFWCAPVLIVLTASGVVMSYPWANNLLYRMTGSPLPSAGGGRGGGAGEAGGGSSAGAVGRAGGAGRAGRATAGEAARTGGAEGEARRRQPAATGGEQAARAPRGEGGESQPAVAVPDNLDRLWARAEQQVPVWRAITMRLPNRGGAPVSFTLTDATQWNAFARSQLTLDASTAGVVRWEPYADNSLGQKLRGWLRFAHTGELGGVVGQTLAGVACLGGVFLVYTGFALACRRLLGWRLWKRFPKSSRSPAPSPGGASPSSVRNERIA